MNLNPIPPLYSSSDEFEGGSTPDINSPRTDQAEPVIDAFQQPTITTEQHSDANNDTNTNANSNSPQSPRAANKKHSPRTSRGGKSKNRHTLSLGIDLVSSIDWRKTLPQCERLFKSFYWPQKVGLVYVGLTEAQRRNAPTLNSLISSAIPLNGGTFEIWFREGPYKAAHIQFSDQFSAQIAILLLNGILFQGSELKVLPCGTHERLPEAVYNPVFSPELNKHMAWRGVPSMCKHQGTCGLNSLPGFGERCGFSYRELSQVVTSFLHFRSHYAVSKDREDLGGCPIINSVRKCKEAVRQIRSHTSKKISLDCEGVFIRRDIHWKLSLLQIATPHNVYLFDIWEGGKDLFDKGGLRDLLEDPSILKITHDCRGDSIALYHEYGTYLNNVFDTQIAYAVLCSQSGFIPLPVSLNTLLMRFADGESNPLKDMVKAEMSRDEQYWKYRPLTQTMISYAQQDVLHLFTVHKRMEEVLKSDPISLSAVFERSAVYVGMAKEKSGAENGAENALMDTSNDGSSSSAVNISINSENNLVHFQANRKVKQSEASVRIPLYNLADWDCILMESVSHYPPISQQQAIKQQESFYHHPLLTVPYRAD
eukprot:TRINITY_DN5559_c0_g1_i6.p1 TRINITY_DN5559_c0_g1~~TRINITY_DN5559_c0_g1_i6.p1  ORF type:complete len:595 (-),score=85.27 TRINITY_DN5559_c0_g1_i6:1573-3357(-)